MTAPPVAFDEDLGVLEALAGAHARRNGGPTFERQDEQALDEKRDAAARATRLRAAAFQAAGTAQLLLDPDGVLVAATDLAQRMFGLTASDLGRPVQELALFSWPVDLGAQLDPKRRSTALDLPLVAWPTADGERTLNVRITPLTRHGHVLGGSITYTDVTARHQLAAQLSDTQCKLADVFEQLQPVVEQFEIKLEELRSLGALLDTASHDLLSATERLEQLSDELRAIDHERTLLRNELHRRETELIEVTALVTTIRDAIDLPVTEMSPTNDDAHRNGRPRLAGAPHIPQRGTATHPPQPRPPTEQRGNGSYSPRRASPAGS